MNTSTTTSAEAISDLDRACSILDPIRLRILHLLESPGSASSIAESLGMPRQKVNYHLRELEKRQLVRLVEERRKGNCTERIVQATATSWVISPEVLGPLAADPEKIRDRFSLAYLVALLSRSIREISQIRSRARDAGKSVATLSASTEIRFANAKARNSFAEELAIVLADLTAKYHDERARGGRAYRVIVGAHPMITRHETEEEHHG